MNEDEVLTEELDYDIEVLVVRGNLIPAVQHEIESKGVYVVADALESLLDTVNEYIDKQDTELNE